jgi:iron complex outermembrane receptor protein
MKRITFKNKSVMAFRRWSSKSYAVFNTIGREVKILSLVVTYFSVLGSVQVFAQIDTDTTVSKRVDLNEVQVTASRTPALYSETGRVVTVITKKEIEKLPVQSIDGLLRYAAGVDIRQRGPLGIQSDVSIRGGSFNQVMILLNGINITDPQTGHFSMNIPVDLESVERIEILEGPGARIFGPSAFSGAINIITSDIEKKKVTISGMGGQHGLYSFGAGTALTSKTFKNYVSGNFSSSDGYIENTDFKNLQLFYNGKIDLGVNRIDIQAGYSDKAFGANSFYTPKYPEQFEHVKTILTSVKADVGKKVKFRPAFYWRRNQDRFELFRNEHPDWYTDHNYHLNDVFGGNVNVMIPWKLGETSLGGEVRQEMIWSNNIGEPADELKPVPGEPCQSYDRFYSRTNNSFFAEHSFTRGRFSFNAGLLLYNNSSLDSKLELFPGIDVSYWVSDNVKLFGSVNKALRMPTFTEMFYTGPTNTGNPDLEPEVAVTGEVGVDHLLKFMENKGSFFYRNSRDLIDWGRMEGEEKYVTRNLSDMNTIGIELLSVLDVEKLFEERKLFIRKVNISYNYLYQDKQSFPGYESVYVMDYLKNMLVFGADLRIVSKLGANVSIVYRDRNGYYTAYEHINGDYIPFQVPYDPFVTVDMRLQWTALKYMLFVDVDNMFNKKYYDIGNVLQPGIWVKAGVKFNLIYD